MADWISITALIFAVIALIAAIIFIIVYFVIPAPGDIGPTGPPGTPGTAANTGATGSMGPRGFEGSTGPTGLQGTPGSASNTGATGSTGGLGLTGPPGSVGLRGPQGVQGNTGDTGGTGPPGIQGVPGIQGPTGPANGVLGNYGWAYSTIPFNAVPVIDTTTPPASPKVGVNTPQPLIFSQSTSLVRGSNITLGQFYGFGTNYSDYRILPGTYTFNYGANVLTVSGSTYFIWLADFGTPTPSPPGWAGNTGYGGGNLNPIPGTVIQIGAGLPANIIVPVSQNFTYTVPEGRSLSSIGVVAMVQRSDTATTPGRIIPTTTANGTLIPGSSFWVNVTQIN
jgi:hypothetical protein